MPKQKVKELPPGVYKKGGFEITSRASDNENVKMYASSAKKIRYHVVCLCCYMDSIISHEWAQRKIKDKLNRCPHCAKKDGGEKIVKPKKIKDPGFYPDWPVPQTIVNKRRHDFVPR